MEVTLFTPDIIPSDQPCWLPWMSKSFFFFFFTSPARTVYKSLYSNQKILKRALFSLLMYLALGYTGGHMHFAAWPFLEVRLA